MSAPAKKELILKHIRERLEQKHGRSEDVKKFIDLELQRLALKSKISAEVIILYHCIAL